MEIVIVDDSQTNLILLKHLVDKLEDCQAITFTASQEALLWCEKSNPDLILVDYMMPNPDGLEFIRRFRQMKGKEHTPLVMITANHQREVRYEALQLGANDFLTKPIDGLEFLVRTKNMLALRNSHRELAQRAQWLSEEVNKITAQVIAREQELIIRLSKAAEYRDMETHIHIERMSHYCLHIAKNLGLPVEEQDLIFKAAPMHDIGKVGIPDYILLKPDKLTETEYTIMKQHAVIGYQILQDSPSRLLQVAAEIALSHHEKYDGSGYPYGIRGEEIPLPGRIVAVADVFDALISHRPYKKAWKLKKATALIEQEAGKHFDPACVQAFFSNWNNILEIRKHYGGDVDESL